MTLRPGTALCACCGMDVAGGARSGQVGEEVAVALDPVEHLVEHQLGEGARPLDTGLDLVPRARRRDLGQLAARATSTG